MLPSCILFPSTPCFSLAGRENVHLDPCPRSPTFEPFPAPCCCCTSPPRGSIHKRCRRLPQGIKRHRVFYALAKKGAQKVWLLCCHRSEASSTQFLSTASCQDFLKRMVTLTPQDGNCRSIALKKINVLPSCRDARVILVTYTPKNAQG